MGRNHRLKLNRVSHCLEEKHVANSFQFPTHGRVVILVGGMIDQFSIP